MAVYHEKEGGHGWISNCVLNNENLSYKAIGLLSVMLTRSKDFTLSVSGLAAMHKEKEAAVRSAIKELEDAGHLYRYRVYKNGRIDHWEFDIYENPKDNPHSSLYVSGNLDGENLHVENLHQENLHVENLLVENRAQPNTDIYPIQNLPSTESSGSSACADSPAPAPVLRKPKTARKTFAKPTPEEVDAFVRQSDLANVEPAVFYDYYESNGWMVGKNKMKDWKATARNWNRKSYGKEAPWHKKERESQNGGPWL